METTPAGIRSPVIWRNTFSQCVMQKQMGQSSSWQSCPDSIARKQEESKTKASKSKHAMAAASMRPCPLPALDFPFTVSNMIPRFLFVDRFPSYHPALALSSREQIQEKGAWLSDHAGEKAASSRKKGRQDCSRRPLIGSLLKNMFDV